MSCSHGCLGPKVSAHFSSPPSLANDDLRLALDSQQATIPWDELTPQPGEFTYPIGSNNRLIGLALEPAFAGRLVRQLGAIFDFELLQELANVELDRVGAEVDFVGDVAVRITLTTIARISFSSRLRSGAGDFGAAAGAFCSWSYMSALSMAMAASLPRESRNSSHSWSGSSGCRWKTSSTPVSFPRAINGTAP